MPVSETLTAKAIALVLSHPFGVGNAHFRIGSKKIRYVDTVPFGSYRREVFQRIGLFDEDLIRNQDDEFNHRLSNNGGKILLAPDIVSYYYHARDTLFKLWKMYFQYGYFKPLIAQKVGKILTWRQLMPTFFVGSLFFSCLLAFFLKSFLLVLFLILFLYLLANLVFSISIASNKGIKYLLILPIVFAILHFSYGLAYLKGIWHFILFRKHKKNRRYPFKNLAPYGRTFSL